ncbi:hypothetical protein AURDEDRAFT_59798 [Auricularia subglabra TFB-10046 SS5]|nr:hypothetical protein AURDEDRAFT_59798 [Auricularia subglabra TFB-10046 SS5]
MHAQLETKTVRDINCRVDRLPSPAHFQYTEVENDQTDDKFDLYWRDPLEVIADLLADPTFADHLTWAPEKRYTDDKCETRLYNELTSGDWMYETQLLLPDGATVIPIIISSDKTELTSFTGKRSCYPVYLTIGNIAKHVRRQPAMRAQRLLAYLPTGKVDETVLSDSRARKLRAHLYHDCMRTVCSSLFTPAAKGVELADSVGNVRRCHPILAAYVADYPEQCLVTCIRYGQACPRCDTLVDGFGDDKCGEQRHQDDTLHTIRTAADLPSKEKEAMLSNAGLNDIPDPFWAGWPHANIHCAITSDILHQLIQGVGKHLVSWLVALAPVRELNARFQRLPLAQGLRHFLDGITKLANVSGTEHKAIYAQLLGCVHGIVPDDAVRAATALLDFLYMAQYECHSDDTIADMQVALSEFHAYKGTFLREGIRTDFDLPKLHSLQHYADSVRKFGATDNYNTEATERLHIDLAKHAFRATNKRRFIAQMCRWLERKEAVHWFATYLAWRDGKIFDARLRKKSTKKHAPVVLAKRPHRRRVFFPELPLRYGVGDFRATLEEFLIKWHGVPTHHGYATLPPQSLTASLDQLPSLRTWNHVKFYTPNTQTLAAPDVLNIAYASADQSRFDTVLVKVDGDDIAGQGGLEGVRVGQLRLIFKLPEAHESAVFGPNPPDHLAYIEWFTKLPLLVNAVNGMFPLRRSLLRNGKRETAIVPVMHIRRACQVFPKFGREPVDRSLTCYTVLDAYDSFFLNNRADKDAYRSIHWEEAQTSDEEEEA